MTDCEETAVDKVEFMAGFQGRGEVQDGSYRVMRETHPPARKVVNEGPPTAVGAMRESRKADFLLTSLRRPDTTDARATNRISNIDVVDDDDFVRLARSTGPASPNGGEFSYQKSFRHIWRDQSPCPSCLSTWHFLVSGHIALVVSKVDLHSVSREHLRYASYK